MTDKEYIENIDKVDTDTLFENLEYYGFDSYYRDLWYATIEELKKRIEIRPQGEWIYDGHNSTDTDTIFRCSVCHREIHTTIDKLVDYPFCHCGAGMEGGAE